MLTPKFIRYLRYGFFIISLFSTTAFADNNTFTDNSSNDANFAAAPVIDVQDPYENFNRHVYKFNETIDKVILKPAATVYKTVLPTPIRKGVGNFFSNLGQIPTIANDLLQAQFYQATADTWRFAINSAAGVGGVMDVAKHIGLPPHEEDFGLTLAKWGYHSSNYLVLPIFGPNTVRDAIGIPVDYEVFSVYPYITPNVISVRQRNGLILLYTVNKRAQLLDYDDIMQRAALDPYVFQRNAYLQRRKYLIQQNNAAADHYSVQAKDNTPAAPNYGKF